MSYKGGDRAEFGIIDNLDFDKDYGKDGYEPERYRCVAICDDALDDWWDDISEMKSYFHEMSRPATALARYGVTLIPLESLDLLIQTIETKTKAEFMPDANEVVEVLRQAKSERKYVIHYGI